jgi:molecular chaperone DnaK (HSP70)
MKIAILLKHYNNNSPEVTKTQISEIAHTIKDTFDEKKEDLRKELRAKFLPETRIDEVEKTLDTFIEHINSKNFEDSDLMQRIKSDALPTLCAIAA